MDKKILSKIYKLGNHGDVAGMIALIQKSGDVNFPDPHSGNTFVHNAACTNRLDFIAALIEIGADVNQGNNVGYTPLMAAARNGFPEAMHLLLDRGADIEARGGEEHTARHCALMQLPAPNESTGGEDLRHRATAVVALLLTRGAAASVKNNRNFTPLMSACSSGMEECARLLMERGAELNIRNALGTTALAMARNQGHVAIAKLLEAAGALH